MIQDIRSCIAHFAHHPAHHARPYRVTIRWVGFAPGWLPSQAYLAGALVKDSNGNLQEAQGAGISGAGNAPTWNTSTGGFTSDGDPSLGLTWKNKGSAPVTTGVTSKFQIIWQGHTLQVTSVLNPDGKKKMLVIMADQFNDSAQQTPVVTAAIGAA